MKKSLKISIALNALLIAALAISLRTRFHAVSMTIPAVSVSESFPSSPVPMAQPFQWSQLESTNDYRTYVANLRAIGCPEPTIRAIVMSDFEAASSFEQRRLASVGESTASFSREATRQAIAAMLGNEGLPASGGNSDGIPPRNPLPSTSTAMRTAGQIVARAGYPLVFQNAVLNDSGLTPNQKSAVRQLQQQFVAALGSPNQNSSDPSYAARWQTAQEDADAALRAQLGSQAYLGYKLQRYYSNFQQVMLSAGDGPVTIDPEQLAR